MSEVFNADVLDAINRALSAENVVAREGEEPVYCNVNNETREIEIPGEITIFGVEYDENAVRVFFKCPKIVGDNVDIDITQSMVYIIYINAGGEKDQYIVTDVNETEDGDVTFSWLINRNPAKYQGTTQFGIRVIKSKTGGEIENEWNTTVANVNILNGVETEDIELSGDNIDVVNQLLDLTKQEIELKKQNSIEEIEQKGQETLETIPSDYTTAAQNALSAKNEVEDIRVGANGETYESAGEAVRSQTKSLYEDLINVNEMVTDKLYPRQDIDFYYEKDDVTVSANRRCFFPNVLIPGTYLERIDLWVAPMTQEQILDIQFEIWKYDNGKIYIMDSQKYSLNGGNTNYEKKSFEIGKELTRNTIISIYGNLQKIASNKNDLKKSRYTTDISTGLFTFSDISETSYTPCVKIYAHTMSACLETTLEDLVFSSSSMLIVNPKNSKAYSSIQKAIDNAKDGDTIIIYPATYKEQITNVNKHLSLIGVDKGKCIIYDDSGNYSTPPLECAYGYYKNLTIIERKVDGVTNDTQFRPYAVHIDIPVLQSDTYVPQNEYENLLFEDCVFISDWAYAVGVGMIKNYTLKFRGCTFISNYDTSTYPTGAFLVHSAANTQTLLGDNQNLICEECDFTSTKTNNIISIHEYNAEQNKMYLTFIRCALWSDTNEKDTPFHINWSTSENGWKGAKSIFLSGKSYGNNISELNAN